MDNFIKGFSAFILAIVVAINAFGNFIGIGDVIPTEPETTVIETTLPEETTAYETSEEILALYNSSVNDAYANKVGFSKERYTDNEVINISAALVAFKDLIGQFMGIGEENKYIMNVSKGEWEEDIPHHYLRKSTLTSDDITRAVCTESNGQKTIILTVKSGSSKASKTEEYNNSPVDKCGICVGNENKSYFDHKTAPVVYSAIGTVFSNVVVEEQNSNAVIKAVVDSETGNLIRLDVDFDIAYQIDIGAAGSGDAKGTTHIIYKDFEY